MESGSFMYYDQQFSFQLGNGGHYLIVSVLP